MNNITRVLSIKLSSIIFITIAVFYLQACDKEPEETSDKPGTEIASLNSSAILHFTELSAYLAELDSVAAIYNYVTHRDTTNPIGAMRYANDLVSVIHNREYIKLLPSILDTDNYDEVEQVFIQHFGDNYIEPSQDRWSELPINDQMYIQNMIAEATGIITVLEGDVTSIKEYCAAWRDSITRVKWESEISLTTADVFLAVTSGSAALWSNQEHGGHGWTSFLSNIHDGGTVVAIPCDPAVEPCDCSQIGHPDWPCPVIPPASGGGGNGNGNGGPLGPCPNCTVQTLAADGASAGAFFLNYSAQAGYTILATGGGGTPAVGTAFLIGLGVSSSIASSYAFWNCRETRRQLNCP